MNEESKKGTIHPLTLLANQALQVFSELGFEIATGPELESDWYNFYVLNFPKDHPALDMQDTFWVRDQKVKAQPQEKRFYARTPRQSPRARLKKRALMAGCPALLFQSGKCSGMKRPTLHMKCNF